MTSESNIYSTIQTAESPSFDISDNFTYNNGQQSTFYDYGFITRKSENEAPSKKIKVYFSTAGYNSSDTGDLSLIHI